MDIILYGDIFEIIEKYLIPHDMLMLIHTSNYFYKKYDVKQEIINKIIEKLKINVCIDIISLKKTMECYQFIVYGSFLIDNNINNISLVVAQNNSQLLIEILDSEYNIHNESQFSKMYDGIKIYHKRYMCVPKKSNYSNIRLYLVKDKYPFLDVFNDVLFVDNGNWNIKIKNIKKISL